MIQIKIIDKPHQTDINLPNEPFNLEGKLVPTYLDGRWSYEAVRYEPEKITQMCFPDEGYRYDDLPDSVFVGAYDGEKCVGLAILQPGFYKYMYLYDLKVNRTYRRQHVGSMLMEKAKEIAVAKGYCGIYTQGQDNNLGACLFYLRSGFSIGGLDTQVYRHTKQEGKADILFYLECE